MFKTHSIPSAIRRTTTVTANGLLRNKYVLDAWGLTKSQTGTLANPFTYTARETAEAWLMFYRARYMAPGIGRFVSEDPFGLTSGPNIYSYVNNKPIRYLDPTGLVKWKCTYGTDGAGEVVGFTKMWFNCTSECIGGKSVKAWVEAFLWGVSGGLPFGAGVYNIELEDDYYIPDSRHLQGDAYYAGGGANVGKHSIGCAQVVLGAARSSGDPEKGCGFTGSRWGISGGWFAMWGDSEVKKSSDVKCCEEKK